MRILLKLFVLSSVIIFTLQREGYMGDTVNKDISLKAVISMSDCIVLVDKNDPYVVVEKIDITPTGKEPDHEKYPAFEKQVYNFVVVDILYAGIIDIPYEERVEPSIKDGDEIKVFNCEFEESIKYHKDQYIRNIMVSPIEISYKGLGQSNWTFEDEDQFILFLKTKSYNDYEFTVNGSAELVPEMKRIKKLIEKVHGGTPKWWAFWK